MARLASRAAHSVVVIVVAASAAFALLHAAPGDPISAMPNAIAVSPELRAQWRAERGLDQPVTVQYVRWLGRLARADFGYSSSQRRPVMQVLRDRIPNTLFLMSLALAGSIAIGAALGAWQGARAGTGRDRAWSVATLLLYSVPEFWLAMLLMTLFVSRLHWLPSAGMIDVAMHDSMSPSQQLLDRARHLVLPWMSLTVVGAAVFARYQRAAMQDTLRDPFVRTARAKGLAEGTVRRQAWRTALLPVVSLSGLFIPSLLTGAVFVERVYGWPGIGDAVFQAISTRDYDLIGACVIIGSAMTTMGSLLADVVRLVVDPRLRVA